MTEFLQSPFTIGFCLVALLAWVLMLCALFWPPKKRKDDDDEPRILF